MPRFDKARPLGIIREGPAQLVNARRKRVIDERAMKSRPFQMFVASAGLTASFPAAVLAQKPATAHIAQTAAEVTWGAPGR
jgi:hypothetical protein